ncbi:hypothetical protein [Streptomyces sp. NBC_00091]|uniref:hypothetical protein n=1 Tax=Streptomyces sp. NBC_00091 TaxID=2975648 RepID=UPI0022589DA3|nr:hypothetical protein [Streptomyces sp. NBC_00091]MCX5380773.1 hypothetical protein [Streptomyces sp. NBC_00091]
MTGSTGTTPDGERPVERRLRQALEARAEEVTVRSLRPADPPGPHLRRLSPRTLWLRRGAWTFAGLSGLAAAALAGYLVLGDPGQRPVRPVPPAAPPELSPTAPSGTPRPSVSPSASVSPAPATVPAGESTPPGTPTAAPSRSPVPPPRSAPPTSEVPAGGSATPTPAGAGQPAGSPSASKPRG